MWYHDHFKSNYFIVQEILSVVTGGLFAMAGAPGTESSLLGALSADIVLEEGLHLSPPAHPGGLALEAAFLPSSFALQNLSHPGEQRHSQGGRLRGESHRKTKGSPESFPQGQGEGKEE